MTKRIIRAITDITQPKRNGLTTDTALRRWLRHLNDLAGYYTDSDQNVRTLWRGQSSIWRVEPGIHTRILDYPSQQSTGNRAVTERTAQLISTARSIGMPDMPSATRQLPDLHLLSFMQHQGFATPLLDFSTDLNMALAMACFNRQADDEDGVVILYRHRLSRASTIPPFTTRSLDDPDSGALKPYEKANASLRSQINYFSPPFLTPRQRIQRGVFLLGPMVDEKVNLDSSFPIKFSECSESILSFNSQNTNGTRGRRRFPVRESCACAIKIPKQFKLRIREWLEESFLLSEDYVYPEQMAVQLHQEYLDSNRRTSPWD